MKLGITSKLFLAILASCAVVAAAMAFAIHLSFQSGFLGYVKRLERQRLVNLTNVLAESYATHGSWDFLRANEREWRRLFGFADRNLRREPEAGASVSGGAGQAGQGAGVAGGVMPPAEGDPGEPGERVLVQRGEAPPGEPPPPPLGEPPGPPPGGNVFYKGLVLPPGPPTEPGGAPQAQRHLHIRIEGPRLTVLDAQRHVVVGSPRPPEDAVERPIVSDGETVGYLVATPLRRLTNAADVAFQEERLKADLVIGAFAVLLAAGVAVLLARIFLAPTRRLAEATHKLAAGDYATRVKVTSTDELGRLGEDFNRLASTLERNEQMRRNFMADVSHELRTPLAIMRGELEAMEDGLQALDPQSVQSLKAEVGTLTKLVDDIYQLSLADVGALRYRQQPVEIGEVLERAVSSFRERLATRGIALAFEGRGARCTVQGDPDRLAQLFGNIFENCMRYTEQDGRVTVRARRDAQAIVVDIEDSGPGVDAERLPRLFDRFYRVESSRNRATGGAGLGLAICRSIVEAHGGTIEARPGSGGGLWLHIALPCAAQESAT